MPDVEITNGSGTKSLREEYSHGDAAQDVESKIVDGLERFAAKQEAMIQELADEAASILLVCPVREEPPPCDDSRNDPFDG
jgi:hypothetical protein